MTVEKLKIDRPVIVEGKYDKITLCSVIDAEIIPTNGFSLFKSKEKVALLRRLAANGGVILLTDADGGGKQIRARLSSILPAGSVTHLYIPEIAGKEKRKAAPSKAGLLGVEGMEAARLREIFAPFAVCERGAARMRKKASLSKLDFYRDGLSGGENAAARRDALALSLDLPRGMSANALLAAVNLLCTEEDYRAALTRARAEYDNRKDN